MKNSLTNPQKSIWYTEQYYKNTPVNNIGAYIYIYDNINFDVLKQTVNEVVKANDNMRLKFKKENDSLVQYINNFEPFDIDVIELSSKQDVINKTKSFANIPFEIENNFLFRFLLYKLPNNEGGVIINIHHIISDSWTLGLIGKEIADIYCKILSNNYEFNKCPSYLDYIEAENEYLNSSRFNKDKEFWEEKFKTVPEIASIPSYKSNASTNISCSGNRKSFNISTQELDKIKEFCANYNVSLYNFFMAVYSLYIGRVCSLDDFVIGTPILNRSNFAQKHTMGMFVSTIPLRINLNYSLSFSDFVKDISSNTMSSLRHQKYSYQLILEHLRSLNFSVPNLYNILLSYQITKSVEENSSINCVTQWVENGCCADELQIHLSDINNESSITVAYDYNVSKYGEQDILDLHSRILSIINQVINNNNILLKNIQIVTTEEKHLLLNEFNNTNSDYPYDKTIVDLFEEQVKKVPNNIAVSFGSEKLTYKQLDEKSNQLANYLASKNLDDCENIGIFTNRSIHTIVGILAILKLGKTFVPIDPLYPLDRINYMINSSKLRFILSDTEFNKTIDNSNLEVILINDFSAYSTVFSCKKITKPENNVYIIFTSGSTGNPKGVTISHKNLVNLIWFEKEKSPILEKNSKILQFATMSFDVSYQEIFSALLSGNTLVLISDTDRKDISNLISYIKNNKISTLFIPPAYLRLLVEDLTNVKILSESVKYIITAGEALLITPGIKELLKNNVQIFNHYGPAETHVATAYKVPSNIETTNVSIGSPISNSQIYILDENNNLCPINVVGQIAIGGDCVGNGYIDKSLNKNKFIDNPFKKNSKLYLTGDLGFIDKNNLIQFIGRKDFQVKINGFRIELDEITKCLLNYNGINSCITIVNEINGKKYIFCYYTSDLNLNPKDIMSFLSSKLPKYMIPAKLVKLDALPINNNGKVDRKALPKVDLNIEDDFAPATTKTQIKLLNIWKKILNLSNISITSDFFNIGGDSLLAIKLSSFIQKEFNVDININDIFENSTIETLSEAINNKKQYLKKEIPHISSNVNYYPLSSAQKRIYYSCSLDENSTLYNIAGGVVLDKNLDVNKLNNCFKILIEKNDSLRTHFDIKNEEVVQIIESNVDFEVSSSSSNTNNLNEICSKFIKPFDLSKAPLLRAEVIKFKNSKTLLLLDMHHIISDGTSLNVLIKELCNLYNGNQLSNKKIDYKDFTLWEQEQFNTKEFKDSKEFWVNQFKDEIPLLNMPTTYSRPSVQSFEGANYYANLPSETIEKINKISKNLNITPYMLMLSCYYILLSKYTSQDDIVVGTATSGRELSELSNIIGMFVNSLALRNKIDSTLTFADFTKGIKENCLSCFKYQSYPFDALVKDLKISRNASRSPLFDTMFIFQNDGYPVINFEGINSEYFIPDNAISKFDLSLEIVPINNEYLMRFEYCTKLFNEDFIKRFSSHYINILNSILENSQIKLSEIDMLSQQEKHQILFGFNNTKVSYAKDKSLIDLFEEQVQKTPNSIAIVFENEQLTYSELNAKANQVARFLIENNICENSTIGIMIPRSLNTIILMLAVLKNNSSYVLIDISLPEDRVKYMLDNSDCSLLITNKNSSLSFNNVLFLEDICVSSYDTSNLNLKIDSKKEFAILFTSGSTGKPKGVKLSHIGMSNIVLAHKLHMNVNVCSNFLSFSAISFDMFQVETYVPLLTGKKIILVNEEEQKDIISLINKIKHYDVDFILSTPSKLKLLLDVDKSCIKFAKVIQLGGEKLTPDMVNLIKSNSNCYLYNAYGPSEITACCSCKEILDSSNISIGKPLCNTGILILDKNCNLCPINVPGEIYVYGDGVSSGYINNEALTKKSFVYLDKFQLSFYKTGDLGFFNETGDIYYIGRNDNQIKLRGMRIELSEIEAKIMEYENISQCAVIYKNSEYLSAFISSDTEVNLTALRKHLAKNLPTYMIPKYITQINSLPLNNNGKIDRILLTNYKENMDSQRKLVEPETELEKLCCSIWSKLLNTQIGITDDIFEYGADSLLAIKFKTEMLANNINIPYSNIFKYSKMVDFCQNCNFNKQTTVTSYNYSAINSLLEKNDVKNFKNVVCSDKNVLLLGANGFVGMHIIYSFIFNTKGKIYCIARDKNNKSAEARFIDTLHFYFGKELDKYIGKRIFVLNGNVLKNNFGLSEPEISDLNNNIDVVINAASLVKHYGKEETFNSINIGSTKVAIDFCINFNKRLMHISSLSISGNDTLYGNTASYTGENIDFSEKNLYINQNLDNVYIKSKFFSEQIVLENILENGLQAQILRLGNITSRLKDGVFQINPEENAFASKISSILKIGYIPNNLLSSYVEFTPVDVCADAIVLLVKNYIENFTVFHIYNSNHLYINTFIKYLQNLNINIGVLTEAEFANLIHRKLLYNPEQLSGIIADIKGNNFLDYSSNIKISSEFSKYVLLKLGFSWPKIDENYIKKYIDYLNKINL